MILKDKVMMMYDHSVSRVSGGDPVLAMSADVPGRCFPHKRGEPVTSLSEDIANLVLPVYAGVILC